LGVVSVIGVGLSWVIALPTSVRPPEGGGDEIAKGILEESGLRMNHQASGQTPRAGTVLIVGASASIGPKVVAAFAARATHVAATFHATPIASPPPNTGVHELDILDAASRADLCQAMAARGGGIDTVVMMPARIMGAALPRYSDADAASIMAVNFTSQALLIRDLLPLMNPGARLLLIGSIAAERGSFDPFYAASKGALIPFAKSLATGHGAKLTVTVVLPGPIEDSTMFNEMAPEIQERHRQQSPRGALLLAADFAQILVDLAQPHWRHANGAVIRVNGGSYV
jgi:3-oxoacyl-[acyl-carrier protein] reductase